MIEQCVIGLAAHELTLDEAGWLRDHPPAGIILFSRNIASTDQLKELIASCKNIAGKDLIVAIDEEGGRVHRIPWTPFSDRNPATFYGSMYAQDVEAARSALFEGVGVVGEMLHSLGFTHNCAPCLDLSVQGTHSVIGERAYSGNADVIIDLGKVFMDALQHKGIQAIGKHFPGHGRATADSHEEMPVICSTVDVMEEDMSVFRGLIDHGLSHLMTAHIAYPACAENIATFSSFWLKEQLREKLGFQGTIWSDDLSMKGTGVPVTQALQQAKKAGCDLFLVCSVEDVRTIYTSS